MSSDDDGAISEAYKAYKLSTNYVLVWLQSQYQLQVPGNAASFTSTNDILNAVRVLQEKKIGVPSSVIASLRNAIAKRREVAAIYQGLGTNDLEHAVFLERLQDILSILTPLTSASATSQVDPLPQDNFVTPNPFSSLELLADESDDEPNFPTPCALSEVPPTIQSQSKPRTSPNRRKILEFLLEDDALGMVVQIIKFIYEYDALQSRLREYSADAARGIMPLPLAATLMSLALHFFMNCLPPFLANDSPKFYALWREAHHLHVKLPQFTASLVKRDGPISGPARIRNLGETIQSFESFRQFVTAKEARGLHRIVDIVHLLPYRRPEARFSAVEPGQTMRDPLDEETVLDVLMTIEDMIAEKPRTPKPKDSVARSFNRLDTYTPIRLAAEEFLNDQSLPPKTGLVMGMDLFLSTYEGFLWADERLNVQSCRELAVRLSKDMQVGILPVITIVEAMIQRDHLDGEKAVLEGLKQLHEDLKNYQRQETPELLYHQAPWTAGHHMAEMLARAHLLGHRITCEWNVVPSTLHMYNALCRSDFNLPKIGLMEELCELFKETLFLGNRPDRNFVSHYRRSTFETSISSGSLKISMNKSATRVLNKPSPSFRRKPVHSALTTVYLNEHRLSPIVLCKLYDLPMSADPSPAMREGVRMATDSPFHTFIENAKDKLLPELHGPSPVARVNHFAILVLCARILRDFSRQIHPSTYRTLRSTGYPKSPAITGAMMADTVLQAIVSEPEMLKMGKTLQDVQMLQAAAEAFESVDKTATLQQFLWKV